MCPFPDSVHQTARKLLRYVLAAVLIPSLLLYLVLLSPPGQYALKRKASSLLTRSLGASVEIQSVRTDLWSRLDVRGLTLRDSLNSVALGRVRIRYVLPALLLRWVYIYEVRLEDGRVQLVRGTDGRVGIVSRFSKSRTQASPDTIQSPSRWKVRLRAVTLREVAATYVDQPLGMAVSLGPLSTRIRPFFPDSVDLRVEAAGGFFSGPWWQGRMDSVVAAGGVGRNGVRFTNLRFRAEGVQVEAHGFVPFGSEGVWNLSATAAGRLEAIRPLYRLSPALFGEAAFSARIVGQGPLSQPGLRAEVQVGGLRIGPGGALSGEVRVDVREDGKARALVVVPIGAQRVELRCEGVVRNLLRKPEFGAYRAQLTTSDVLVDSLAKFTRLALCARGGVLRLEAWAEGRGIGLPSVMVLRSRVSGWTCRGSLLPDLWLQGEKRAEGPWQCDVFWGANSARVKGRVERPGRIRALADVNLSELSVPAAVFGFSEAEGSARFRGELFGSLDHLGLQGELWARDLRYSGSQADTIWARLRGSPRVIDMEQSYFRIRTELSRLQRWLRIPDLGGQVRVEGTASGPLSRPELDASLLGVDVTLSAFRADSLRGRAHFAGDSLEWSHLRVYVDTLELSSYGAFRFLPSRSTAHFAVDVVHRVGKKPQAAGHVAGTAWFGRDSLRVHGQWTSLDLRSLASWFPRLRELRGVASGTLSLEGPRTTPTTRISLRVTDLAYGLWGPVVVAADAALDSSLATFQAAVQATQDTAAVHLSGQLPVRSPTDWRPAIAPESPMVIWVQARDFDLQPLTNWLGDRLILSGRCDLGGHFRNTGFGWEPDLEVRLQRVALRVPEFSFLVSDVSGEARLSQIAPAPGGSFRLKTGRTEYRAGYLDSTRWEGRVGPDCLVLARGLCWLAAGSLLAEGTVPLRGESWQGSPLRISFRDFPVNGANAFLRGLRLDRGTLNGEVALRWAGAGLSLDGRLRVGSSAIEVQGIRPAIQLQAAAFRLASDTLRVEALEGSWGRGRWTAGGWVTLGRSGLEAADLRMAARDLSFAAPDVLEVRIAVADLRLNGEQQRLRLSGRVDLGETRFVRDLKIADLTGRLRGSPKSEAVPRPFLERLDLDVGISAPKRFVVDTNLGKLRLDVNLAISGTAASPRYTGEVQVTEGYVLYLDRKFEITRGVVRQLDPYRLNPELDLEAVAQVTPYSSSSAPTTYRITLRLAGNLEHPTLALESEPALSQTDIVSLLTLGRIRSPEELSQEGGPGLGAVLVERARQLSSRQVAGIAERQIERLLNLESVTIEGNLFELNQSWAPRVTITKRLAERLNLSYQTVVGHTNEQRIKISYRLTPILYVDGETDEMGQAGIDLRARVRFK
ncbi:MAG: translocation/assembly module TamB [candidate division KSB1 bacterium]|nr:translocation/assembly module TamB [candidate division KSB1 bacterium]